MKTKLLAVVVAALVIGCGAPTTTPTDGGTQPGDSGTTNNDSGTTVVDAGKVDAGTSAGDAGMTQDAGVVLNGCSSFTTSADPVANIAFSGTAYTPSCLSITAGRSVKWSGAFSSHPLKKGTPDSATAGSPNNPIVDTSTGIEVTFAFPTAGDYPFYCNFHTGFGMKGVVRVQ